MEGEENSAGEKSEVLVDRELGTNYGRIEVGEMLQVALLCTQYLPSHRPKMSEVVRVLQGDGLAEKWAAEHEGYSDSSHWINWVISSVRDLVLGYAHCGMVAAARYRMSPRHYRLLLLVIQITKQIDVRHNLVLGYAVAVAAVLSSNNPFLFPERNFAGAVILLPLFETPARTEKS